MTVLHADGHSPQMRQMYNDVSSMRLWRRSISRNKDKIVTREEQVFDCPQAQES